MYGDMGHGTLLMVLGLYLIINNNSMKKDKSDSFRGMLPGRFLIAMMGCFAVYSGFIYNDFMSIAFNFWGSCYDPSNI